MHYSREEVDYPEALIHIYQDTVISISCFMVSKIRAATFLSTNINPNFQSSIIRLFRVHLTEMQGSIMIIAGECVFFSALKNFYFFFFFMNKKANS